MKYNKLDNENDEDRVTKNELINRGDQESNTMGATPSNEDERAAKKKKIIKFSIIGAIVVVILVLVIVLPLTLIKKDNPPAPPVPPPIIDNYNPYTVDTVTPAPAGVSGTIKAATTYNPLLHLQAMQTLLGDSEKLGVDAKHIPVGVNNQFTQTIRYTFGMHSFRVAHMVLTDDNEAAPSFSIPDSVVPQPGDNLDMRLDMVGFDLKSDQQNPFSFSFTDPLDKDNVFLTTEGQTFLMMDKFVQMNFVLPSQRIFGFGERVSSFQLTEGVWNLWAAPGGDQYDNGADRGGTASVHPFILVQGKNQDDFFGLYFRSSAAQAPILRYTADGKSILSYVALGGQLEVYFLMHGSAREVLKSYQSLIGKPSLPPFWAFGWHQSSGKWQDQDAIMKVVKGYSDAGLPLDAIYLDSQFFDQTIDFTPSDKALPDPSKLLADLHASNKRVVVAVPSAILAEDLTAKNTYYTSGTKDKAFITSGIYQSPTYQNNLLTRNALNQKIVLIDWFNDKCTNFWSQGLLDLQTRLTAPFDGLYLSNNEPTTSIPGEEKPTEAKTTMSAQRVLRDENLDASWYKSFPQTEANTFNLPFVPYFSKYGNYDVNTASLNATHKNGFLELHVHNLYGHMQASRTNEWLKSRSTDDMPNRPFVMSRSTFASSNRFVHGHWSGSNQRTWDHLKYSIASIMNMNLHGIPHSGADVCGTQGDKQNDVLCLNWIKLAAFQPMARFNYDAKSVENEPFLIQDAKLRAQAKSAMIERYSFLRMMYTCEYEASTQGGTCFDPLFYHFSKDTDSYEHSDTTFILAGALKVSPTLEEITPDMEDFDSYFPKGATWVNLRDPKSVIDTRTEGGIQKLPADGQTVHVHLKSGSLIPYQDASDGLLRSTTDLLKRPIQILANRDDNGYAQGSLMLDEGLTRNEQVNKEFEYYQITLQSNSIQNLFQQGTKGKQTNQYLDQVKIFNAPDLSGVKIACYLDNDLKPHTMLADFDTDSNTLKLQPDEGDRITFNSFKSIHFGGINELNLCSPQSFQYTVKDGQLPIDLDTPRITVTLEHVAQTLPDIQAIIRIMETGILNIKWEWVYDAQGKPPVGKRQPFELPDEFITTKDVADSKTEKLSSYIKLNTEGPFQINVLNQDSEKLTFFSITGMLYDEYLNVIQATAHTKLTDDKFTGVFGLGERANKDFFYQDGTYTMWARDAGTPDEDGQSPGKQMYGTHPFFMFQHAPQQWAGVLYKLAAAQDWQIRNNKVTGDIKLQTLAVGGIADIYVILEITPQKVVQKYFTMIGNPVMIPQWSLGWHQCRYGYRNLQALQDVLKGYQDNKIPLDVLWSDIDYMYNYRNFQYDDQIAFKGLPDFIKDSLHANGMRYVPILDAGLAMRPNGDYPSYTDGLAKDVFLKINGETLISQVWPNDATFPDYYSKNTAQWWKDNLSNMYELLPFDGLWHDMNEVSNFCQGTCYDRQNPVSPVKTKLKYIPSGRDLEDKSIPLDATHANGFTQLDTHNIYGTQMVKTSHQWFTTEAKSGMRRTFIIERASIAGMGKYGSRWLGDNKSQDKFMSYSISGVMLMNMFGIPVSGADICGFQDDTTAELCTRWHYVGAFYPFSRNHNGGGAAQEPYVFTKPYKGKTYMYWMTEAIKVKYSLIRYYYTQLFLMSSEGTGSFFKPMFFEFPDDLRTFTDITNNIMLGEALKLSINTLNLVDTTTNYYFPAGLWCSILGTAPETCFTSPTGGIMKTFPSDLNDYQVHLRQGYIVPLQDTQTKAFSTSKDLQSWEVDFHILGNKPEGTSSWSAAGVYLNDDGETLNYAGKFNKYQLTAQSSATSFTVNIDMLASAPETTPGCTAVNQNDYLGKVYFYNAKNFANDGDYDVAVTTRPDSKVTAKAGTATYDAASDRLILSFPADPLCLSTIAKLEFTKQTP